MRITGVWETHSKYMVHDLDSGRSQMFNIVNPLKRDGSGERLHEDSEMSDWAQYCREQQELEWQKEAEPVPMSKDKQHELGGALMEIKSSKEYRRNALHGRYW